MTRRTAPLELAGHLDEIASDVAGDETRHRRDYWSLVAARIHLERLAEIDAAAPSPVDGMTLFRHRPLHRQAVRWEPNDPTSALPVLRIAIEESMAWEVKGGVLHLTPEGQGAFEVRPGQWLTLTPGGRWGAVDEEPLLARYQEVPHP